ncbi:MAG: hypothetical protein CMI08_14710 [Oceanospirillaceae bacterium]|uniref:hypothetical protein n=1 Tax=unclassified Thalassolituus TaxID=2624967 RepID=UPI000C09C61B|nr:MULTISPECIES: hypothetical protein [unclassified Thalassolituus]MAK91358.1 hypothetical protein [Thalassolituus sp.]MAS24510.1 hypothetical protein [Oceanospirillaceae bacterium]MAY00418.1 hypothetical protein [Oceanospirillaceae bacterium]MBL34028.1 hypothetical protein [Oceanospirillaceae bacterium]MBS52032.1 hypothetical protein [Oceanospirillaceae bacterium]|tara:strand:+ start:533 stop:1255 length:723 start_codon:yes stop_codon:yes gene_type:complete
MTVPQRIALLAVVLPFLTIGSTYGLSVAGGHVPLCIPWFDGCSTITATGVYYPAAYVFRAGLISTAVIAILWWYCVRAWLESVGHPQHHPWVHRLVAFATVASILLVASIAVLGEHMVPSRDHKFLWRFHTITAVLFFLTTAICQIVMTWRMRQLQQELNIKFSGIVFKQVLAVLQLLLILWLAVIMIFDLNTDGPIEIAEWWLASLSSLYFGTTWRDWKEFRLTRREKGDGIHAQEASV